MNSASKNSDKKTQKSMASDSFSNLEKLLVDAQDTMKVAVQTLKLCFDVKEIDESEDIETQKETIIRFSNACKTTIENLEKSLDALESNRGNIKRKSKARKSEKICTKDSSSHILIGNNSVTLVDKSSKQLENIESPIIDGSNTVVSTTSIPLTKEITEETITKNQKLLTNDDDVIVKKRKRGNFESKSSKLRLLHKLKANPEGLERTIPLGPTDNETIFDFDKRVLIRYKELNGNILVPSFYVVPWNSDWPEDMWGHKLGYKCGLIRIGQIYTDKGYELAKIGFDFSNQKKTADWETLKSALLRYKELNNGSLIVPQKFEIPTGSNEWAQNLWGLKLGFLLKAVRLRSHNKIGKEHREDLQAMGVICEPLRKKCR